MTVKGIKDLEGALEDKFGKQHMRRIVDNALIKGAQVFKREIASQFQSFKDTGQSIKEIHISQPMTVNGVREVKIYWRGPKDRYRIIHLNEFGTIKNPNPDGKGAIQRALRSARNTYINEVRKQIERLL
ncbi:HK97-gp10 family putative phage morphogenesis protein [Salinicoccus halodurans]|nr:HK97-gp10 family putative phage morphogenesis protein [Salinicoccus halodurans]